MTTAVIVQARMGSTRYPAKMVANLCGLPVLWHVLTRCLKIGADVVALATPDEDRSMFLERIAWPLGVRCYRGPEHDVLARYLGAARHFNVDVIMRVTGDCPLIDPEVCANVLDLVVREKVDYAANCFPTRTFEKGLDCEAFTRAALEMTAHRAQDAYDREHVTPWMQRNTSFMRGAITSGDPARADTNWCVDYPHDLTRLREVLQCA
jgi:spore coat polysaccharide biosynthesis protein SpsF